jgi:hypothetical protein
MENKNNNEIIDRVKLLMGYKLSMTLNENLSVILEQPESRGLPQETKDILQRGEEQIRKKELEGEKEEPGKPKQKYIWPIPGYTTYYTPTPNSSKGGQSIMYFPLNIEDSVKLWKFATPSDFPDFSNGNIQKTNFDTAVHFEKILPFGTVRNFKIDGKQYLTRLSRPNNVWVFKGFYSGDEPYVSPDPEDFKSDWDKFLEKYKDAFQIIASVLAAIIIEVATAGTGTAFAVKLLIEVVAELAINAPIAWYEHKMGDDAAAGLSLLFSLLPFLDTKFLGIAGVRKPVAEKIAKELLDSGINDGVGLAKFYDNLATDEEKYLFSQVLQQRPETIEKALGGMFKQIFADPVTNKKIFRKLAFKDKTWWKTAGMQFTVGISLCLMKIMFSKNYSQKEYDKMKYFIEDYFTRVGDEEGHKDINELLKSPDGLESMKKFIKTEKYTKEESEMVVEEFTKHFKITDIEKKRKIMDSVNNFIEKFGNDTIYKSKNDKIKTDNN